MTKFVILKIISIALFVILRAALLRSSYASLSLRMGRWLRKGMDPMQRSITENAAGPSWFKARLPWMLVLFRLALGPGIVWLGLTRPQRWMTVGCIVLALVSDIYDGVLARRWRCDTSRLRRWDTLADTVFYLGVLALVMLRYPMTAQHHAVLFVALVAMELGQHLFAWMKFGRNASYHSILAKVWGLLMAAATIAFFGFGLDNWFLDAVLAWGIVCNAEGFAMSLVLPIWQRDVPTLGHALRMRKKIFYESSSLFIG
ncbi:MAG TPA: CDP-alcohol phosphatidyltransferase family protein [Candidatus Saccharimonadales bacterium]|jgi:phosphatidylglycerophosphate synthase|nr:CDP-alcohol phosphatidyltransferase family protein [Candidatus Saccharimonadales bacterium]